MKHREKLSFEYKFECRDTIEVNRMQHLCIVKKYVFVLILNPILNHVIFYFPVFCVNSNLLL